MEAVGWLRRETVSMRRSLRRTAAFTALAAAATVAQAWFLAGLLAAWVAPGNGPKEPGLQGAAFLGAAAVRAWAAACGRRTAATASLGVVSAVRARLLRHIQARDPVTLRNETSGDVMARLVDGVDALGPYFARYVPQMSAAVIIPVIIAVGIFRADWVSGLVVGLSAPLIPLFMILVGQGAERAAHARFAQLRRLGTSFIEALAHLTVLRELGAAERVADWLDAEGEDYRQLTLQVLRVAFLSSLVLEFFGTVSIALIAVLIGFRLLEQALPFREGLFVLLLAPELYSPLRALGGLRHARLEAVAAAQSLLALDEVVAPPPTGLAAPPAAPPHLVLEAVTFAYGGQPILRGCSCTIGRGQITALVGPSGSGKSTLLQLLLGFVQPQSGQIKVDGADLAGIDRAQWRARISWVPQTPYVFAGSLRHNLLLAEPDADAQTLEDALARSGLDGVAAQLAGGLDTPLGEHGAGLSGGELQRLGLARAWLRAGTTLWLFDEATAHLDAQSARRVEEIIRKAARTHTVLLVAHRMCVAEMADWVIVVEEGRVTEEGPPAHLRRRAGAYGALLAADGP
ncbi:MAG: thiol reductant ABC exporter subunit CydD [Gammaproteobacteria bacterium]|nr:thiol reductant ABC exporter subunit CydD [Gammaproteobacteria bacterium]